MSCKGYFYPVVKLIKKVLRLFALHVCRVYLVIKSHKLLISCCIYNRNNSCCIYNRKHVETYNKVIIKQDFVH